MDPLSNSSVAAALKLRILQASSPTLAVMLKDGLVVAGEVLEVSAGTAFLSFGGRRVPADTGVELQPGEKFLARVQRSGDTILLRLLDTAPDGDRALAVALRTVMAEDRPAAALLSKLATELRAHAETLAQAETGARAEDPAPKERTRLETLLRTIERFVFVPDGQGESLSAALVRSGLFHEALLGLGTEGSALALEDLKTVLLTALADAPEGPERESIRHALFGLEAEQLLDVARTRAGDPRHVGLAVPDGQGLATAHLLVHRDGGRATDRDCDRASPTIAVDLAVSFTNLGPVRAEFRLTGDALGVRFVVASTEVGARLNADHERLVAELAAEGITPHVQVQTAASGELDCEPGVDGVSFLRDHALLDLLG